MFELSEIEDLANQVNLTILYEIAINSAQIGNEILKVNYNKIQKISSKGRKGDLITNVDLEVENKIKEYLLEETPNISINAEESGKLTQIIGSNVVYRPIRRYNKLFPWISFFWDIYWSCISKISQ